MIDLTKRTSIEVRLQNTKQQYYILKIFNYDGSIKKVHTSKKLNYLQKIAKKY